MVAKWTPARIELFFSRDGSAWRLYARGWVAPYVRDKLDRHREAFPVAQPDAADLERYMWNLDAPYAQQRATSGGLAIEAAGRSAVMLWEWIDGYLARSSQR